MNRRVFLNLFGAIAAASHGMVLRANEYSEIDDSDPIESILPPQNITEGEFLVRILCAGMGGKLAWLYDGNAPVCAIPLYGNDTTVVNLLATSMCIPFVHSNLSLVSEHDCVAVATLSQIHNTESLTLDCAIMAARANNRAIILTSRPPPKGGDKLSPT